MRECGSVSHSRIDLLDRSLLDVVIFLASQKEFPGFRANDIEYPVWSYIQLPFDLIAKVKQFWYCVLEERNELSGGNHNCILL